MSNLKKGNNLASNIELSSITVDGGENNKRDNWWEHNVSEQFPIKSVKEADGSVDIEVSKPHEGCIIKTTLKNSKMNGESRILSSQYVLMATLTFVDGIASGPCTIYDNGHLLLQGTFVNGYLEGKAKEYDAKGQLISEWFYEKGKKLNIIQVKEMGAGYWKECDENGNIIRISQKDDSGNNNGYCFYYDKSNNLDRVCQWINGSEVLYNGQFKLFDEPHQKWLEGTFVNGYLEGKAKEYDAKGQLISEWFYEKGKKLNIIQVKEMGAGYWKECDENGNIIRISQKDDSGNNNGLCYSYSNGKVSRVSLWKEGKEVELLKQFSGNTMIEYKNGHKVYEGEYLDSKKEGYPRNGKGIEFDEDGKTKTFQGNYKNGKRHGKGEEFQNGIAKKEQEWIRGYSEVEFGLIQAVILLVYILLVYISFAVYSLLGTIILALMIVYLYIRRKHFSWLKNKGWIVSEFDVLANIIIENHLDSCDEKKCKSKTKKCCRKLLESVYNVIYVVLIIIFIIFLVYSIFFRTPYAVGFFNKSYNIGKHHANWYLVFKISNYPFLQKIEIKNIYYYYVLSFTIKNCISLQSIQIGLMGSDYSYNLYYSSFVIRSIELILNI